MSKRLSTMLFSSLALVSACEKKEVPTTTAAPVAAAPAKAEEKADTGPIKVGILHSLSGTMAISETSLKDVALMTIEEINEAGGCSVASWSRWWSTRRRTGRCSPRRPAS